MAKGKYSSGKSTPKKIAAKKGQAGTAAAPLNSVAEKIAATAPVSEPNFSTTVIRTSKPSPGELYDEIRRRAYEFYTERGGQHGSHEADWHRAESEVRSKYK